MYFFIDHLANINTQNYVNWKTGAKVKRSNAYFNTCQASMKQFFKS